MRKGVDKMNIVMDFPVQNERYGVKICAEGGFQAQAAFPVVVEHLYGGKDKVRYDRVTAENGEYVCAASIHARNGNRYALTDVWRVEGALVTLCRRFTLECAAVPAKIRLFSDFDCFDGISNAFGDYQFVIPGALYNHNDSDGDGVDDYLGTYQQDYRDDRNPSLSATCYSPALKGFLALLREDIPKRDQTLTRDQIRARHFEHDTDVGSLGIAPSCHRSGGVSMHMDFPFYERNSFCLNVDGSEWSAYRHMAEGDAISLRYGLFFGWAEDLTDASWQTTRFQMDRILNDAVELPFTLEESVQYRRELIFGSYREFPKKNRLPCGLLYALLAQRAIRRAQHPRVRVRGRADAQLLRHALRGPWRRFGGTPRARAQDAGLLCRLLYRAVGPAQRHLRHRSAEIHLLVDGYPLPLPIRSRSRATRGLSRRPGRLRAVCSRGRAEKGQGQLLPHHGGGDALPAPVLSGRAERGLSASQMAPGG